MGITVKKKMTKKHRLHLFLVGVACTLAALGLANTPEIDGHQAWAGLAALFALGGFTGAIVGWDKL